jgi:hypothetical protein
MDPAANEDVQEEEVQETKAERGTSVQVQSVTAARIRETLPIEVARSGHSREGQDESWNGHQTYETDQRRIETDEHRERDGKRLSQVQKSLSRV